MVREILHRSYQLVADCTESFAVFCRDRREIVVHMLVCRLADTAERVIYLFHIVECSVEPRAFLQTRFRIHHSQADSLLLPETLELCLVVFQIIHGMFQNPDIFIHETVSYRSVL